MEAVRYSDAKVANRDFGDFGWEIAHGAVSRRPLIPLDPMVHRTGRYDVGVWDVSIIQGPFSVAWCQTSIDVTIRNFCIAVTRPPPLPIINVPIC